MKVTLATLNKASQEDVYWQVHDHLLRQGKLSTNSNGTCAYRGRGGLMCAAGCLIDDAEYRPNMEMAWSRLLSNGLVPGDHADLIQRLQVIHDQHCPSEWHKRLAEIRDEFGIGERPEVSDE